MRQLRFVGPGDDSSHVVVQEIDGDEQFALSVGDDLRAALRSLPWPKAVPAAAPPTSARGNDVPLTPRDIQVRVRAGESPDVLAAEAGVSPDRIQRFAYAVIQERLRITSEARRARARQGGPEGPFVIFGEAVDERFEAHGIDRSTVSWDAVRPGEGPWTVTASWLGGDSTRTASWTFLLGARTLVADDDTATELLSDRPVSRPTPQIVDPPAPPPSPIDLDAPESAAQSAPTTSRDNVRRLPSRPDDQFFDQDAPDSPAYSAPVTPLASFFAPAATRDQDPVLPFGDDATLFAGDVAAPAELVGLDDDLAETMELPPAPSHAPLMPPAPEVGSPASIGLASAGPESGDADHPNRGGGAHANYGDGAPSNYGDGEEPDDGRPRARIPSWDDILLGVRRKQD
jgi:hypothetical protein